MRDRTADHYSSPNQRNLVEDPFTWDVKVVQLMNVYYVLHQLNMPGGGEGCERTTRGVLNFIMCLFKHVSKIQQRRPEAVLWHPLLAWAYPLQKLSYSYCWPCSTSWEKPAEAGCSHSNAWRECTAYRRKRKNGVSLTKHVQDPHKQTAEHCLRKLKKTQVIELYHVMDWKTQ